MLRSLFCLTRTNSPTPSHPHHLSLISNPTQPSATTLASQLALLGAAIGCIATSLLFADSPTSSTHTRTYGKPSRSAYKYLICGGGLAAQEALTTFIERNHASDVLLVSPEWGNSTSTLHGSHNENHPDVMPPTFALDMVAAISSWIPFSLPSSRATSPEIVIGPRVKRVEPSRRVAVLDDDTEIGFEKCLIAVGNSMPRIPVGRVVSKNAAALVSGAATISDWEKIQSVIRQASAMEPPSNQSRAHFTVVGGGWMSAAIGAALVERRADVTFSYAEPAFLARYFPKYVARELLARFMWESDAGVDSLSYAALRYIIARNPLQQSFRPVEAEVHMGTVFDSFSIIDFRTDHVVFAPTIPTAVPVEVPMALVDDGGFVVNAELMVTSDVYAAGASLCVGSGALNYPRVMRWSADHAKSTGRHAALNILGAREPYAKCPTLTVHLNALSLSVHVLGDVDGSSETFGYFLRNKERDKNTSGGRLDIGVLFCVSPSPLGHRGAVQKLSISGVALWEGSAIKKIPDIKDAKVKAHALLEKGPMSRPELETVMDQFATDNLGISLFPVCKVEPEISKVSEVKTDSSSVSKGSEDTERMLKPLRAELRKPSPGVIWRRHRSARTTPVRRQELLWIEDEWARTVSPESEGDKKSQAYSDLLRGAAGQN